MVRNCALTIGGLIGNGENNTLSNGSCSSMYSLNDRVILLPLNWVVESFGTADIKTGGRESLGPPVGGIILAQPDRPTPTAQTAINNKQKMLVNLNMKKLLGANLIAIGCNKKAKCGEAGYMCRIGIGKCKLWKEQS